MHGGHKSRPCGPRKMHEHRFCKMLKHASFPFKSTEGSGPSKIHEQRSRDLIPERGSGAIKMRG